MSSEGLSREIWQQFPELPKRLWQLVRRPAIEPGPLPAAVLVSAFVDLFAVTAATGTIVAIGSAHAPGLLAVDPDELINWPLFTTMLLLNSLGFTLVLYALLIGFLYFRARHRHVQLITHCLRSYALMNVLITFLVVIGVNELIANGEVVPRSGAMVWLLWAVLIAVFVLALRLLLSPVARYLRAHFRSKAVYVGGIVAVLLALRFNPVIAGGYFSHVIEKESFCAAVVQVRFERELSSGEYSRDCLVAKCVMAGEKSDSNTPSGFSASACPVLSAGEVAGGRDRSKDATAAPQFCFEYRECNLLFK